jgi:transcriptional regulator with XRE-family HTH domain
MPRKLKDSPEIETELAQEIGNRIAAGRKKRGITQVQLAEAVGISQKLVSSYEVGRITLSAEMLLRIVTALKVSSDEILGIKKDDEAAADNPSLKLVRRLIKIEQMPPNQQKALLKNIDMFLKASEMDKSDS